MQSLAPASSGPASQGCTKKSPTSRGRRSLPGLTTLSDTANVSRMLSIARRRVVASTARSFARSSLQVQAYQLPLSRTLASSSRCAAPPPPPPKSGKTPLKTHKPSSKVNARTSRLLRSQLGSSGAGSASPVSAFDPDTQSLEGQADPQQDREDAELVAAKVARTPKLKEVNAFATASRYDLNALIASGRLPPDWQLLEDGQVIYLPSWPAAPHSGPASFTSPRAGSGEVFILRSGAYVTWGINAEQARRFKSLVLTPRQDLSKRARSQSANVERGPYEDVGEEEMEYLDDASE